MRGKIVWPQAQVAPGSTRVATPNADGSIRGHGARPLPPTNPSRTHYKWQELAQQAAYPHVQKDEQSKHLPITEEECQRCEAEHSSHFAADKY